MRAAPGLAPAILDLLAGRAEPILVLVRGDAQRVVGREAEALRDHAAAAGRLTAADAPSTPAPPGIPEAIDEPDSNGADEPEAVTHHIEPTTEDT
jgi:hypothetical protein